MEDRKKQERNKMIRVSILALLLGICLSLGFLVFRQSDEVTVEKGNKVKVIDVSSWNKTIQWRKVKKEGIYYAMLRIGVGQNGKISSILREIIEVESFIECVWVYIFTLMQRPHLRRKQRRKIVFFCYKKMEFHQIT